MLPTLLLLLLPLAARAEGGGSPSEAELASWSTSVVEAARVAAGAGDVEAGRALYETCAGCHHATGIGDPGGTMPQIAGQHRSVLIKQMLDIRSGRRKNPIMAPYLEKLEDASAIADVAAYVAGLAVPRANGKGPGVDLARGRSLYESSCARCHGQGGEGQGEAYYPALRGQHYRYLVRQLIDLAGGRRGNAHPEMVVAIQDFSARDVARVADYVSRLSLAELPEGGDRP